MDKQEDAVCYIQINCLFKHTLNKQFLVPEGASVSVIPVFSLLTFVTPRVVTHTQTTQVAWVTGLVGTWYAALLEVPSHR